MLKFLYKQKQKNPIKLLIIGKNIYESITSQISDLKLNKNENNACVKSQMYIIYL